jgi:nucleoside-diphosphate-sugar epimerase
MRILVPGHRGYIGQVLTPLLHAAGHEVVGLDTGYYAGRQFLPEPQVPALEVDLRDVVPEDLAGFDAVIFLAALSNDALGDLDASLTHDINDAGTLRFARAACTAWRGTRSWTRRPA